MAQDAATARRDLLLFVAHGSMVPEIAASGLQPIPPRADDACVHPGVAGLSLEEKGFVLGAALARMPPARAETRLPGPAGARCAAALAALADEPRPARAAAIAALTTLIRAPVPAGIDRIHPDWLRERFERESTAVVRAAAVGLPGEVRRIAADVRRARGEDGRALEPDGSVGAHGVAALQRTVFAGLVPLAGPGGPSTPVARELAALAPADLVRAIETRGAETLGRSLRGAPAGVVASAAAALGSPLAAIVLEASRAEGDADARERARRIVAAAGVPATGTAALAIGTQAIADALATEGGAAVMAIAQRLPPEAGRRLLAAANGIG